MQRAPPVSKEGVRRMLVGAGRWGGGNGVDFFPFCRGNGRPMHPSRGRGQVLLTVLAMETGFFLVFSAVEHACPCSTNASLAALCF